MSEPKNCDCGHASLPAGAQVPATSIKNARVANLTMRTTGGPDSTNLRRK